MLCPGGGGGFFKIRTGDLHSQYMRIPHGKTWSEYAARYYQ